MTSDRPGDGPAPLRVAFVPGVTPDKWARIWRERMPRVGLDLLPVEEQEQIAVLFDGRADMCFVRLPVQDESLHVIPLYHEVPVVVVPKEHFVEAADEVTVADLADEHLLQDPDLVPEWRDVATEVRNGTRVDVPPMTVKQAVETIAAGVGIIIVPMSVARLHHRKDVVYRPVGDVAESRIGLAWPRDLEDERLETFIGVVRGRSARSTRGATQPSAEPARPRTAVKRPTAGRP
ncbi:MAG TPA: LysR family substrate-binding domain-containing protein, partial [Nocardioidaceae bacterium]|nr:LysR family substrate-binding domain-containing protein [Nocardioidaceae bacterium]